MCGKRGAPPRWRRSTRPKSRYIAFASGGRHAARRIKAGEDALICHLHAQAIAAHDKQPVAGLAEELNDQRLEVGE
jgi:hypothetical protein